MSQLDRANLNTDIVNNVYTNTVRAIKGNTVKQRMLNLLDSSLNIIDDLNVPEGYLGIDSAGRVDVGFINSASPSGLFLRDDGTWAAGGGSGSYTAGTGLQLIGNQFSFASTDISQFTNNSGYITSAALTGFVPYTGASANLDMGVYGIKATALQIIGGTPGVGKVLQDNGGGTGVAVWATLATPNFQQVLTAGSSLTSNSTNVNWIPTTFNTSIVDSFNISGSATRIITNTSTNANTLQRALTNQILTQVNITAAQGSGVFLNQTQTAYTIGGQASFAGAQYIADYSANYNARSLVDMGYVTAAIAAAGSTKRLVAVTQSATPAVNTNTTDIASITGLAQAITSMTTNLTGTPVNGQMLMIQITDDGTSRAITWGTAFGSTVVSLPTTTVSSTLLRILVQYNSVNTLWECIAQG